MALTFNLFSSIDVRRHAVLIVFKFNTHSLSLSFSILKFSGGYAFSSFLSTRYGNLLDPLGFYYITVEHIHKNC